MRGLSNSTRVLLAAALFACALAGCSSKSSFKYDQLDVNSAEEELSEFSLGKYQIPIPVADERHNESASRRNRFQFDFELYAVVSPKEEAHIADVWDRHQGVIRDRVINICRSASVEELREPELATLKSRLTDVLAMQLGEKRLRQLLIIDIVSQAL